MSRAAAHFRNRSFTVSRYGPRMNWSHEEAATAQDMWAQGLSASVIAMNLEGRTRNAVIGKLHRIGGYKRWLDKPSVRIRRVVDRSWKRMLRSEAVFHRQYARIRGARYAAGAETCDPLR